MKPFRFYLIALLIIVCDQISKTAVLTTLPYGASRKVIGNLLSLTHTHNTGGAFSLFQAQNSIFVLIAGVAIVALIYAYQRYQRSDLFVSAALALALGGAVGNLIDRVRYHFVVDFFDIHVWPIFNIADSAITIGIILLAFRYVFSKEQVKAPVVATDSQHPTPKA